MRNTIILENQELSGDPLEYLMRQDLQALQYMITSHYIAAVSGGGKEIPVPSVEESQILNVFLYFLNHLAKEQPKWLATLNKA